MNVTFWLAAAIMIVVALLFIIPPIWRLRKIEDSESDQRNISIAREQAQELKNQLDSGFLTQELYDQQLDELESTLVYDLDISKDELGQDAAQGRWISGIIVLLFPLLSVFIYYLIGEPDALVKAEMTSQSSTAAAPHASSPGQPDVNAMVNSLAEKLKNDPNNPEGWIMLGRSYKHLQRFSEAAKAYEQAYRLLGDQPDVMLQYADSLAMSNQGKLAGKAAELVFKALEHSPDSQTALWLAGMAKAEAGEFSLARGYWNKLLQSLAPGTESYLQIQKMLSSLPPGETAEIQIAEPKQQTASNTSKSQVFNGLQVEVILSDALKAKASAIDTVFIYAKALSGPPMPLAITRKTVSDLPIKVELNDSMAMMPQMKISNFNQVQVIARVSKSGTAQQLPGDLIGSVKLNDLRSTASVLVHINQVVK